METNKDKKEALEKTGITVCSGWLRGCFNETTDGFKKCLSCREAERIKDKDLRNKKVIKSTEFNENNKDKKMCKICNKVESTENFDNETIKCSECSVKSKLSCKLRNPRDKEKSKLYDYKKSAKKRNLIFELSDEEFFNIVKSPCHYCEYNDSVIGVDRKNSNKGYIKTNVLPCCEQCNLMKNDSSYDNFLSICEHIATINNKFNGKLNHKLFHISPNGQFARFRGDAERRNIKFELTKDKLKTIVLKPCAYCKSSEAGYYGEGAGGIDRVDSTIGYLASNCVPCCYICNQMKLNYSKDDFINQCIKITKKFNKTDTLEADIIDFFEKYTHDKENVKRDIPTFFHSNDWYEFRKWQGDINDLINIKIELEFVENSDQKDLWNYYRWKISSLRTFKPNNFTGRIICILIKDSITQKYLGIMSLSSDILAMKNRDDAIGWTNENKINNKKINHLMNLSTCVSIQPFGYNFNGGKLLAKLAFSKEVINKFKEKFNQELLVISTTGLYGKSVQYDRLKELEYVGKTKGNSIYWIPDGITAKCREYLKLYHNYETSGLKKLSVISKIISVLNLNKEDILSGNEKGIYVGFTRPGAKKYLCEQKTKLKSYNFLSAQEIFNEWVNRWAKQRYTHLLETNRIEIYKYIKSTERTSRHREKLKKDLGEEKYKELVHNQNQKSYTNKKSKIDEILQNDNSLSLSLTTNDTNNSNNIKITSTERVKKHKEKLRKELGEEKYKELIRNQNQKIYANKKSTLSEIVKKLENKDSTEFNKIEDETTINNDKLLGEKMVLPKNFSFFKENNDNYFCLNKYVNKKRHSTKYKLRSNNIQKEFDDFINIVNLKFPELKIQPYKILNIPKELNIEHVDNTNKTKPVMPQNFSICNVNDIDYFQFNKKIDEKRFQYKTKINSYDLQIELENFIDQLNEKYDLGLIKSEYKIINTNGWKTTNKIVEHVDTDEKIAQRLRTLQNIEKKKQELGIEEFRKQKAIYAKQYRESKKEIVV